MENNNTKSNSWYEKTWLVFLLCLLFFPAGLYALWKNSSISKGVKIGVTSFIALVILANLSDDDKNQNDQNLKNESNNENVELIKKQKDSIVSLTKTKKKEAIILLKDFRKSKDEFENTTFYEDKRIPNYTNVNFIFPYIGNSEENYYLRLKIQYASENWLFIDNAIFMIDDEKFNVTGKWERDNNSQIWEWLDIPVEEQEYQMLKKISNSKVTKIRFNGRQYHDDRTLTSKEKDIIKKTLQVFDKLK